MLKHHSQLFPIVHGTFLPLSLPSFTPFPATVENCPSVSAVIHPVTKKAVEQFPFILHRLDMQQ